MKRKVPWYLTHREYGNRPWAVQEEAMHHAMGKRGWAHFLEQGLGKTGLAFNEFVHYYQQGDVDCCIVVCPNSMKSDWTGAPQEWGFPGLSSGWHPKFKLPDYSPFLMAVNFEAVRSGFGDQLRDFAQRSRVFLVIDESLALGDPASDQTKAAIKLADQCAMVRLLNGTPIGRSVMNYHGQLRAIGELVGCNPYQFRNRYAKMGGYMGKAVVGTRNEAELGRLLARCSFRATKEDWRKDLPPKIHKRLDVGMTPKQTEVYRRMVSDFYVQVGNIEVSAEMVLTQMGKLRQISSGLAKGEESSAWIEPPTKLPKFEATLDIIRGGETKVIVSHVYRATGEALSSMMAKAKIPARTLRGQMSPGELEKAKRDFNNDPEVRVMVAQQGAAFRGHTLIGGRGQDRCNRMVFFENDFSYYQRSQMEDRTHRGAQDQDCLYFDLCASPADEAALAILQERKDLADAFDVIVKAARERRL